MSQRLKQLFPGFLWLIVLAALAVALVLLLSRAASQRIAQNPESSPTTEPATTEVPTETPTTAAATETPAVIATTEPATPTLEATQPITETPPAPPTETPPTELTATTPLSPTETAIPFPTETATQVLTETPSALPATETPVLTETVVIQTTETPLPTVISPVETPTPAEGLPVPPTLIPVPTPTPWPTPVPWPTPRSNEPTPIPQPTPTPLPLPTIASDASGSIIYSVRSKDSLQIYAQVVDPTGKPQASPVSLSPKPIPITGIPISPQGQVYAAPDGSRLAIVNNVEAGELTTILYTDTGKQETLFKEKLDPLGIFFNWHPDSRHVIIRADDNYVDVGLWLVNTDNGGHAKLVGQYPWDVSGVVGSIYGADVSPDGQQIAFSYQTSLVTNAQLWRINANGSEPKLLAGPATLIPNQVGTGSAISTISWSPDGRYLAFSGEGGLIIIEPDGSNPRILTPNFTGSGHLPLPVWSPDSRMIAFIAYDSEGVLPGDNVDWNTSLFQGANIHLVDIETGKERALLNDGSTGNIDPVWSPDGKQIAFASTRSGTSELWVVNVDGTNLRQITNLGQAIQVIRWPGLQLAK